MFDALINVMDAWLQQNRPTYYQSLQPGVSQAQIAEFEVFVGTVLPSTFKAFYLWRNGESSITAPRGFLGQWSWMPLELVRYTIEFSRRDLAVGEYELSNWWNFNWIPFLENGGGDNICLDLDGAFDGESGQILEFYHDNPTRDVVLPNFAEFLDVLIRMMTEGELIVDDTLRENYDIFMERVGQIFEDYPIRAEAG